MWISEHRWPLRCGSTRSRTVTDSAQIDMWTDDACSDILQAHSATLLAVATTGCPSTSPSATLLTDLPWPSQDGGPCQPPVEMGRRLRAADANLRNTAEILQSQLEGADRPSRKISS